MTNSCSTTVAITGAGGSLGKALALRLLENGRRVKALVRNEDAAERLGELGAEPVLGDVRDRAALEELVEDCRHVFHLAAWMGDPFDEELASAVNVTGTENVLRAAGKAGVARMVLASSIAVYGPVPEGLVTEESPLRSTGDLYGDTKIQAETVARREAGRGGVELTILRPTMIYGPESPSWTKIPFDSISKGLPIVVGSGEDLADPVYLADVARAFELAASTPEAASEAFNVGAGPTTWNEFLGFYAAMAGKGLRRVPAPLARGGARAAESAQRTLGLRPRVVAAMVGVMTSRAVYSREKAARILGFSPEFSLEGGMRETEAWLRDSGRLKRASVALVTGAAGGLGRETAGKLRDAGVTVWAADLEPPEGLEGVHPIALDVTSDESIARAVEKIEAAGGPVDLLVNIAGLAKPDALERQVFEDVEVQFAVNAYGPLKLARAVAPGMRRRGWGRIVNVSSTNGFVVTPFMGAYSASKYALEALSDALRMELKPWGVEVVVLAPGAINTAFAEKAQGVLRERISTGANGWNGYLESFLESPLWGTGNAASPQKVAAFVARTALSRRAPARRLATLDAVPARVMSVLPTFVRDAFFARASGLHHPPGGTKASRRKARSGR
ncbi:MAG: SDR family NAD(P)-dependent oxidoreductase [Rubrobacteraceae bacterium]